MGKVFFMNQIKGIPAYWKKCQVRVLTMAKQFEFQHFFNITVNVITEIFFVSLILFKIIVLIFNSIFPLSSPS